MSIGLRTLDRKESNSVFELHHRGAGRRRLHKLPPVPIRLSVALLANRGMDRSARANEHLYRAQKERRSRSIVISQHGGYGHVDCNAKSRNSNWTGAPSASVSAFIVGDALPR